MSVAYTIQIVLLNPSIQMAPGVFAFWFMEFGTE